MRFSDAKKPCKPYIGPQKPQKPAPDIIPYPMPRRAYKRQQSPRGPACPIPPPVGGGLRRRGQNLWPRLMPNYRPAPWSYPWRATNLPHPAQRHFHNRKNPLPFPLCCCKIEIPRQKRQDVERANSPRPYAGANSPTQQCITAPTPIIAEKLPHFKGACVCVCGVGKISAPLLLPRWERLRGPGTSHPQGPHH